MSCWDNVFTNELVKNLIPKKAIFTLLKWRPGQKLSILISNDPKKHIWDCHAKRNKNLAWSICVSVYKPLSYNTSAHCRKLGRNDTLQLLTHPPLISRPDQVFHFQEMQSCCCDALFSFSNELLCHSCQFWQEESFEISLQIYYYLKLQLFYS